MQFHLCAILNPVVQKHFICIMVAYYYYYYYYKVCIGKVSYRWGLGCTFAEHFLITHLDHASTHLYTCRGRGFFDHLQLQPRNLGETALGCRSSSMAAVCFFWVCHRQIHSLFSFPWNQRGYLHRHRFHVVFLLVCLRTC